MDRPALYQSSLQFLKQSKSKSDIILCIFFGGGGGIKYSFNSLNWINAFSLKWEKKHEQPEQIVLSWHCWNRLFRVSLEPLWLRDLACFQWRFLLAGTPFQMKGSTGEQDNGPQPAPVLWYLESRDIHKNEGAVRVLKVHGQQGNHVSTGWCG